MITPNVPFFLPTPASAASAVEALPAFLRHWFAARFGTPTAAQSLAWPALAAGHHLLLSSSTGTGKTLAAFLPILADLLVPRSTAPGWSDSPLRALYVAPLKALVADAGRNLEAHLTDLMPGLPEGTRSLRLATRTGDTAATERRRLLDDPPDLLLTTPESLAVLLSQARCTRLLANLRWVVVDEVHALAGDKRGADLTVSLERLEQLADGPLRRIGLSATALPLTEAARFLVGPGRPCAIAHAGPSAPPRVAIEPIEEGAHLVRTLVERLVPDLPAVRATLIFTNTRGLAERLSWALRRGLPDWNERIAVHHSALSAQRRREVEEGFKAGHLRTVVSSTSLELGVDIGPIDRVVLVHPPGDVIRLLQRIGRAGHAPGRIQSGLVLTANPAELLEATVTAASGLAFQCEPLRLPDCPLDVLCQQMLGMACARPVAPDDLFALVRRASPFADLDRRDFDDCLAYLHGLDRHGEEWLPPRLGEDGDCVRIVDERTARLVRRNLGTILSEQTVEVHLRRTCTAGENEAVPPLRIGEVDEGFAERLEPGDRFLLDGRCLEYRSREDGNLLVEEVLGRPQVPRWGGNGWPLSPELAHRLYLLRIRAAEALREGQAALDDLLRQEYGLRGRAVEVLAAYFERQEALSEIPDTTALLVEGVAVDTGVSLYLHTPLNRLGNDALVRVGMRRLVRDHGLSAVAVVADLGFALRFRRLERGRVPDLMRQVLAAEAFDADLDAVLAESTTLRDRFARVAQTGLMLLRNPAGRRKVGGAGWGGRELFEQVRAHDGEFVLLRQALREVRGAHCDAAAGERFAREVAGLTVRCRWLDRPSPFVEAWTQREPGESDAAESSAEALRKLHARLMGAPGASAG